MMIVFDLLIPETLHFNRAKLTPYFKVHSSEFLVCSLFTPNSNSKLQLLFSCALHLSHLKQSFLFSNKAAPNATGDLGIKGVFTIDIRLFVPGALGPS